MKEIKVKEIEAYDRSAIGRVATLLQGADKANAYGINIRLFKEENDSYVILVNDISISCDTEEQVTSTVRQILLNVENNHQQGIIPVLTFGNSQDKQQEENFWYLNDSNNKISLEISDENNPRKLQVYDAKLDELLMSGKPLEETAFLEEELIKRATVSTVYQGETVDAVDFNIERKA